MSRIAPLALVLALAACDATAPDAPLSAEGLSLTADRSAYDRGAVAALTFRSEREAVWTGVLGCPMLERRDSGAWVDATAALGRACPAVSVEVDPGDTLEAEVPLDVPAATYRFSHWATPRYRDGAGARVSSAPFEVR